MFTNTSFNNKNNTLIESKSLFFHFQTFLTRNAKDGKRWRLESFDVMVKFLSNISSNRFGCKYASLFFCHSTHRICFGCKSRHLKCTLMFLWKDFFWLRLLLLNVNEKYTKKSLICLSCKFVLKQFHSCLALSYSWATSSSRWAILASQWTWWRLRCSWPRKSPMLTSSFGHPPSSKVKKMTSAILSFKPALTSAFVVKAVLL